MSKTRYFGCKVIIFNIYIPPSPKVVIFLRMKKQNLNVKHLLLLYFAPSKAVDSSIRKYFFTKSKNLEASAASPYK